MPLRSGFKRKSTAKRAESSGGAASEHDVEEDLSLASTEEFENFRSIVRAIIGGTDQRRKRSSTGPRFPERAQARGHPPEHAFRGAI